MDFAKAVGVSDCDLSQRKRVSYGISAERFKLHTSFLANRQHVV